MGVRVGSGFLGRGVDFPQLGGRSIFFCLGGNLGNGDGEAEDSR